MKKYLKKLWNGEEKLWKVFWLWFVLLFVSIYFFTTLLSINSFFIDLLFRTSSRLSFYSVLLVWETPRVALRILLILIVWRNASNCEKKIWEYSARVLIALFALLTIYGAIDLIIYVYDLPNSINYKA